MSFQVIIAGILAAPALLVSIITAPIIGILSIPSVYLLLSRKIDISKSRTSKNNNESNNNTTQEKTARQKKYVKQVIVTGGSSGIGLEVAKEAARHYNDIDKIYIIARDQQRLDNAKQEITDVAAAAATTASSTISQSSISIETISLDVSNFDSLKDAAKTIMTSSNTNDKNDYEVIIKTHIFCCAGEPFPYYYEEVTTDMYTTSININLLGQIYTTNAFLPYMKQQQDDQDNGGGGTIMFCSSGCGLIGIFGYTAYCSSKFGIRGFAECLYTELLHYPNIHIQIAFPSDTKTPGYDKENLTKPIECQLLSEGGGYLQASTVGTIMYKEATIDTKRQQPKFFIYFNLESFVYCTLGITFGPVTNLLDGIVQICTSSILRYIALFYYSTWSTILYDYKIKSYDEKLQIEKKLFPNRPSTIAINKKKDNTTNME